MEMIEEHSFRSDNDENDSQRRDLNSGSSAMYRKIPAHKRNQADSEIQTESNPSGSFIDHKYEFSEWKLRQRALNIADLRNKATHSSQTEKSHFRRESETQMYLPKVQGTQTTRDNGQNPIKKLRYIKGLRGDPSSQMSIVNMELEIDGSKNNK